MNLRNHLEINKSQNEWIFMKQTQKLRIKSLYGQALNKKSNDSSLFYKKLIYLIFWINSCFDIHIYINKPAAATINIPIKATNCSTPDGLPGSSVVTVPST